MTSHHPEKGTISISFVREAIERVSSRGIDPYQLLVRVGISPDLLFSSQARVPSENYGELWKLVARALDDEFFGMDSHPMKLGSFGLLCKTVVHSDTLESALQRALRFMRAVLDDIAGELRREGETAIIVLKDLDARTHPPSLGPPNRAFVYGTFLTMLHGLACWLVGRRIPILKAEFRCTEPHFSDEWRVLFTQSLQFGRPATRISFPASYLELINVQNERTMKEFLRGAPANFLFRYKNSASFSARIRRRLRESEPMMWPDFDVLARQFNVSTATLRRRLDDEGNSYRSITDDLRRDLAISMLSEGQQSIANIASELGFAESSAFHRAFKKWTGLSPGQYRNMPEGQGSRVASLDGSPAVAMER